MRALAVGTGALCAATGAAYLTPSPTELPTPLLAVLGLLGAGALGGAGIWQARSSAERDRRPLLALSAVALLYVGASGLGVAGARFASSARLEQTGLPIGLHAAGIVAGAVLFIVTLAALRTSTRST